MSVPTIVLGSQSPRREALLRTIAGKAIVRVVRPLNEQEPGFDDVSTLEEIDNRVIEIARLKFEDVRTQLVANGEHHCLVTADTVIVASDADDHPVVLGKPPPEPAELRQTIHHWFTDYFAGRKHLAKTALCVGWEDGPRREVIVTSEIWFRADTPRFIEDYLRTGESVGKAGGYAIQEGGSLFVERIEGSLSNIVGLPLVETLDLLNAAGLVSAR